MFKEAVKTMLRVGRAATSVVGLAVVLALSVGVATSALAGTGVGATFNLGQTTTVNAVSKLVGSVAGPSLQIDSSSTNANVTALELRVETGKARLKANSQTKVALLNVDKLDGQDAGAFMAARTYVVDKDNALPGGGSVSETVSCDTGDVALGGHRNAAQATHVEASGLSLDPGAWQLGARDGSANANNALVATVRCAAVPPLR